ncbi:hypothetical protein ES319_A02G049900v1 [Gossypium barbadense]|uniref:Uncharacterized protein n=4 Tax=Gossypium TaxID=3633 RepID=A0ABR0QP34_GOSAR|nr:hypothetical protein ES319_A02G049900v1 [Gossypium barbadense]KAK5840769.1 hypothetical protein PVK06_009673 [Gossypium arboreum]TYH27261.1 hypothetical protein ES288_A02G055100v1 [Gossypium darwinii]TYI38822.1 hypothetical protein ES332_A02G055000v1 [Gossypium tomentosum]
MDDKMLDISCFFLIEDSGDSEHDSELSSMDITTVTVAGSGGDEDDAESCSCDTISTERLDDFYQAILKFLDDDGDDQDLIDCNDDQDGDERPGLGMDLCREAMDGMEDRLFWETCMAVGYP